MDIKIINNTIAFDELLIGSEFVYKGELHIKIKEFEGGYYEKEMEVNAVNINTGTLRYFNPDEEVEKCNCKIEVYMG